MGNINFLPGVPLKEYTSFKVGGNASYFVEVDNQTDLMSAFDYAKNWGLPLFILGQGSNILVADTGFDGIVIKNNTDKIRYCSDHCSHIIAESGVSMAMIVKRAQEAGLTGMEWAAGLPGTIGGAVVNNSGCNGGETKDIVSKVRFFKNGQINVICINDEWDADNLFSYRNSWFKENKVLILEVELKKFEEGDPEQIKEKMKGFIQHRAETQPHGLSVGCIFKNPQGTSAGKLIDAAGLKGFRAGNAQVSVEHANFIVNVDNNATARDIMKLIEIIEKRIFDVFNVRLEREIICLGF